MNSLQSIVDGPQTPVNTTKKNIQMIDQKSNIQHLASSAKHSFRLCLLLIGTLLPAWLYAQGPAPGGKPATPNTTFTQSHACGVTTITRQTSPPAGVIWYWQSQTDGSTYQGQSGTSYSALASGWYYLRAYNGAADPADRWSDNRQSVLVSSSSFQVVPSTPSAPSHNHVDCDETILTRGAPPSGVTWYWQNSASGTSTSSVDAQSTKTFTSSGTYYLRARHNTNLCWSTARSGSVSVGQDVLSGPPPGEGAPPPAKPVTCLSKGTPTCGLTILSRSTTPPAGVVWYWQTSSAGTSTSSSGSTYNATSAGTYYLRAYDPLNSNWSSGSVSITISSAEFLVKPGLPAAPNVANNCGESVLTRGSNPSGATLYWHSDQSNPVIGNTSTSLTMTSAGTYYISARHNVSNCWSDPRAVSYSPLAKPAPLTSVPYSETTAPGSGGCGEKTLTNDGQLGFDYYFLGTSQNTTGAVPFTSHQITTTGTYYFTNYNGTCHSDPFGVPIQIWDGPVDPNPVMTTNDACGVKIMALDDIANQSISFPNASPTYLGLNGGKHEYQIDVSGDYTVRVTKTVGCTGTLDVDSATFESVSIDISDLTVTLNPNKYTVRGGGFLTDNPSSYTQVHLRESEADVTYKIFNGSSTQMGTITGGGNKKSAALPDGTYTVEAHRTRNDDPGQTCMVLQNGTVYVVDASTQFVDRSFSSSKAYKVPKEEAQIGSITPTELNESITYFDDKGRPVQSIVTDASPDGRDLIQHMEYDALGRQQKSYLPFAKDYNRVYHIADTASANQASFYTTETGVAHDSIPYSEVTFDNSPMNRVKTATGPGKAWHTNNKNVSSEVLTNATADSVRRWKITNDTLINDTYYAAGQLRKQESTNEDGNQQIAFISKEGQVVLTKVQAPGNEWNETYHVYDDFGRLRYTLPPLAVKDFASPGFGTPEAPYGFYLVETNTDFGDVKAVSEGKIAYTSAATVTFGIGDTLSAGMEIRSFDPTPQQNQPVAYYLDDLIFQYEYDHLHRLIAKKVPGADWEYMVYDERDRIVLTQNGNQRANNEWAFIKYDQLNRPIMTGLKTISGTTDAVRTAVAGSTTFHETFDSQGIGQYTNNSYPTGVTIDEVQTVTYYDKYGFTTETFSLPAGIFDATNHQIVPDTTNFGVIGLTTGSWAKISGTTDQFVKTVNFYDEKYRLTQTATLNHKGDTDRMTAQYNWQGQLTKTHVAHDTITIVQTYTYDHMGRPLTTTHSINGATAKTIASYSYNALGQLENKSLADGYEDIDYTYNIRSQLTKINDPGDSEKHLFEMAFKYENATNAKYDGTIGAVDWKNPFEATVNSFDYTYDEQNRLTGADFSHTGTHTRDYGLESISYDANSNIKTLKRKGDHDDTGNQSFDDLTYAYDGNQLMEVTDAASMSTGFDDQANDKLEYGYDANGNLVEDQNKGITSITYNHLNQPLVVTMSHVPGEDPGSGASGRIEYVYAAGAKVQQKEYRADTLYKTTDYVGGFLYQDDTLRLIAHDQGRIVPGPPGSIPGSAWEYQYHLTDHLGNIRVTFKTEIDTDVYEATMETENNAAESPYFYNLDTRHTHANSNHTPSGNESSKLDQNELVGPAIALPVIPGDTIDMEVYAYYEGGSGYNNTVTVASFINALAGVFGGTSGAGGESGLIFDGVDEAVTAGMGGVGGSGNDNVPAAYLSYILFDQNYKAIQHGYHEISSSANLAQERLFLDDIAISEPGYLYIYTSMQSDVNLPVFFDDLKVTHQHSPVIQKSDYLPFGLEMQSYTRPAITAQNFKFNSGSELNETTKWYQTPFRNYDPALGRFHGVDALAPMYASLGPSHFVSNNPIMFMDPTGLKQDDGNGDPTGGFWGLVMAFFNQAADNKSTTISIESGEAEVSVLEIKKEDGEVYVLDPSGKEWVPATEIVAETNPNQNQAYRQGAEDALDATARHAYDYGSSLSLSGNVTLFGGLSFELGFAWDNDQDVTGYLTLGPSFGFDASIGVLAKDYAPRNQKEGFDVTDMEGYGASYNAAGWWLDATWGGSFLEHENDWFNPFTDMGETYYESGAGVSLGSPIGATYEYTYTWTFGTTPSSR